MPYHLAKSPYIFKNDSNGNRTRVTAVKGRCLNRLTMEPKKKISDNGFAPRLTPRVGLEPTTTRLTAECSTIELSRKISLLHKAIYDENVLVFPQNRTQKSFPLFRLTSCSHFYLYQSG